MQDDESKPEQSSHTAIAKERGKLLSSLIMSLFKRLYNFFGSLLTILIITLILLFIAWIVLSLFIGNLDVVGNKLPTFMQVMFLLIFVSSIYYLVSGVFEFIIIKRKSGEEDSLVNAKRMILRGIAGVVVLFLLYFFISGTASLFARDEAVFGFPKIGE